MGERERTAPDEYYVKASDESLVQISCDAGAVILGLRKPRYGSQAAGCNSTDSYRIVAAACLGEQQCVLRSSADVYGDPCPAGTIKSLELTYWPSPSPSGNPIDPQEVDDKPGSFSSLWGRSGERWSPAGKLTDWSYAGYAANDQPIPDYPAKFNVQDFGAVADGRTDSAVAFQKAVDAAARSPYAATGVAVEVPAGRYVLRKAITITNSNVALRGAGAGKTVLYFPQTMSELFGPSPNWAFGGSFISIVGRKVDSAARANFLASITKTARRGDRRLQARRSGQRRQPGRRGLSGRGCAWVSNTDVFRVGQWVRLWASNPGNRSQRRRSLLSLKAGLAAGAATPANLTAAQSGRRLASDGDDDSSASGAPLRLFQDPYLQAAVAAAAAAEAKAAAAAAEAGPEPDKADALSADPVAAALAAEQEAAELNPLQLDAMLLAAARYGSMALAAEIADGEYDPAWLEEFASNVEGGGGGDEGGDEGGERAPAQAVPGSLDYYLYGDSRAVDSGADYNVFPKSDHIRMASRVSAVGDGWIELERPLPWDMREQWAPVLHRFAPTVQNSGLEGFTVEFAWSTFPSHFSAQGANAIALYDAANCWVQDIKVINGDNGIIMSGVDFITVDRTRFEATRSRGKDSGHHALWTSRSADVRFTSFWIEGGWVHDISLDQFAELMVYANGGGTNVNIDCHRAGSHSNLFSNINFGAGTRPFWSGGEKSRGAHSGANNTFWNLWGDRALELPPCSYGPMLTFVGNFGGQKSSRRRELLAQQPDAAADRYQGEAFVSAVAVEGGPIIIPEEEEAKAAAAGAEAQALGSRRGLESAAGVPPPPAPSEWLPEDVSVEPSPPEPAAQTFYSSDEEESSDEEGSGEGGEEGTADDGSSGEAGALAVGGECRGVGWFVERIPFNRALPQLPADLFQAQLVARKLRQAVSK
ncbi:hypothetical protein CHLNCDRAFT_137066 [Chlorella variabilis]|uniref:Rhamnogalacturonase A/B/Epimerase-like pectate lyase domain-containing protein n=1 Tax=Chlorella variabilis TaxID=554065 RepID=E1ZLX2_CHLVA|nr:hypothetical protein CHLNCDRAFT_137066 [Chlorella variabilis]EFN53338.1 hypothetical protein CHLNCDRAFT_137066 [Chlorella variabilis]|eukprot:XP_005845440.1 hypothetical protein CHLNCDRAFT_137066 [Chlorella variabilis]